MIDIKQNGYNFTDIYHHHVCPQPNEIYSDCNNNACQKTCDTKDDELNCKHECKPGCICRDGFVRNKYGECIRSDQCGLYICLKVKLQSGTL